MQFKKPLFWDKKSCKPITNALSWQDSRAQVIVDELLSYNESIASNIIL